MIRTIRYQFQSGGAICTTPASRVRVVYCTAPDRVWLILDGQTAAVTPAAGLTEAETLAALGWSSAPPPAHPLARDLLDQLAACYDDYGEPREGLPEEEYPRLMRTLMDWCGRGYPGARRVAKR